METIFGGPVPASGPAIQDRLQVARERTQGWERLEWVTDKKIAQACLDAEQRARRVVQDSDSYALVYDRYGSDWIRSQGMYFFHLLGRS